MYVSEGFIVSCIILLHINMTSCFSRNDRYDALQKQFDDFLQQFKILQSETADLRNTVQMLKYNKDAEMHLGRVIDKRLDLSNVSVSIPLAFTVSLTKTVALGTEQAVKYDAILTNIGNGYNPHTGIFTALKSGVYLFFVSVVNTRGHSVYVDLVRNGIEIANFYNDGTVNQYSSHSQTVLISLNKSDMVWVRNKGSYPSILFGGKSEQYNVFSGVCMGPIE